MVSELEPDLRGTVKWVRKWLVNFNAGKTQLFLFNPSYNTDAIDAKKDGSVGKKNLSFKMPGLTFSFKLDWGFYIISIAKTASKKIGALIRSMKFLSTEVALYLYKSTILLCMEYCCHIWGFPLVATENCLISYWNRYAGLLFFHFLLLMKPWFIIKM